MQYLVLFVVLNLAYNNDLSESEEIVRVFNVLYIKDLCKTMSEHSLGDSEAATYTLNEIKLRFGTVTVDK
jgi:hypothetical protein